MTGVTIQVPHTPSATSRDVDGGSGFDVWRSLLRRASEVLEPHTRDEVDRLRKQLARDQPIDLVAIDKRLAAITIEIRGAVRATGTTLTAVFGIGSVNAAMIRSESRQVSRFATRQLFAAYNASAPAQWGSGGDTHDRVNLGGSRRLNHAVHIASITEHCPVSFCVVDLDALEVELRHRRCVEPTGEHPPCCASPSRG
jgi:transposase